jgi:hypothetical protein
MLTRLPPPAPMLEMSMARELTMRSCSSSNVVLTNGSPSVTTLMSQEVPPTSAHSRLLSPINCPKWAQATVPAAGPEKTMRKGCSIARSEGTSVAAQSAKLSWPSNPISLSPSLSRSE